MIVLGKRFFPVILVSAGAWEGEKAESALTREVGTRY